MSNAKQDRLLKRIDMDFQPKFFNGSDIEDFLKNNEKKVIIVLRVDENKSAYDNFDNDFSAYLEKLPQSPLKIAVGRLFNKRLVYYGTAKNADGTTWNRLLISKNDKLAGIVLNAYALDISIKNGTTPSIDDVVYSTYYGLVRAAVIINKQEIIKDKEFHKLITNFLGVQFLKILGKNISVNPQQKTFLNLIATYLFYRQFLEMKHPKVVSILNKNYTDVFPKESLEKFSSYLDKLSPFNSFKDLPRIVQMFGIADVSPPQLTMSIIRFFSSTGFHTIIGSLDGIIASIVLAKYPTEIVSRGFSASNDVHDKIENKVTSYINKITYEDEFNTFVKNS